MESELEIDAIVSKDLWEVNIEKIVEVLNKIERFYTFEEAVGKGAIYLLISPSGKCYVGQSWRVKERIHEYKVINSNIKGQPAIYRALLKYGSNNLIYKVIDICITQSQEELDSKEIFYINFFNSLIEGYNLNAGGHNSKPTAETRKKQSEAGKGRIQSPEHRKKRAAAQLGSKNHQYGIPRTSEQKKFISDANFERHRNKKWKYLNILINPIGEII